MTKYVAQLADFSVSTSISTAQGYFNYWKNKFVWQMCEIRPELNIKPSKYDKQTWQKNLKELQRLRTTLQTCRIQGLKALSKSTEQAEQRVRRALSSSSQEEDSDEEDENEDCGQEKLGDADKLIKSILNYTKGNLIVADEKCFVQQMAEKSETLQDRLHGAAASNLLLEDGWNNETDINTKLCLPSIVNLISPRSKNFLRSILIASQYDSLQATHTLPLQGLPNECLSVFDELINDRLHNFTPRTIPDIDGIKFLVDRSGSDWIFGNPDCPRIRELQSESVS
ncbi:hypothetical protein BDC45DRAFT_495984 [Circinella umbellata]|nr:hypothetical protein BDC45DRAFT_495984 [Circinella umbellata]